MELLLQVELELSLIEELLKRASAGQDTVAELDRVLAAACEQNLSRNHEGTPTEVPCLSQGFGSFGRIFDDIDDVPQVDDIGQLFRGRGAVHGIPAFAPNPFVNQEFHVFSTAAPVIEDRDGLVDQAVSEGAFDGTREVAASDRGFVARDGVRVHCLKYLVSGYPQIERGAWVLVESPAKRADLN